MQVLKGVGFLGKVKVELGPLKMFKSRNSTLKFDMLHVNLSVGYGNNRLWEESCSLLFLHLVPQLAHTLCNFTCINYIPADLAR